jgi:hypothetical protein
MRPPLALCTGELHEQRARRRCWQGTGRLPGTMRHCGRDSEAPQRATEARDVTAMLDLGALLRNVGRHVGPNGATGEPLTQAASTPCSPSAQRTRQRTRVGEDEERGRKAARGGSPLAWTTSGACSNALTD